MYRTLIVARMNHGSAPDIADIFAASDRGPLPHLVGVQSRSLFTFGDDLYLHLFEADRPSDEVAAGLTRHADFHDISGRLARHVNAYDPEHWRSPKDAMAREFYHWQA